ncbi:hypothetical protein HAX54_013255 [Datura stramonium]|uniref:DNA-directed RNA polymerase n=1 Tax=Datura stramonium TaxID=4076 RepID=A0ABS8TL11_DATST|nr:hypothetical protein [Datura stramonium]
MARVPGQGEQAIQQGDSEIAEAWFDQATEYWKQEMNPNFRMTDPFNPVHIMSFSGARGNASQLMISTLLSQFGKSEEGEDEVKSLCPLCPGRHTCYNGRDKGSRSREGELTPKTCPQFELQVATRLHEAASPSSTKLVLLSHNPVFTV